MLLLLLHQAAAVAVVPRGSCVFLSYKRLLGQPTDFDLDGGSSKSISVLGPCLRFASFPLPLRLSLSHFTSSSSPALLTFIFIISSFHLFSTPSSSILFHLIVIFRFFAFRFMFLPICKQFHDFFNNCSVNLASKLTQKPEKN